MHRPVVFFLLIFCCLLFQTTAARGLTVDSLKKWHRSAYLGPEASMALETHTRTGLGIAYMWGYSYPHFGPALNNWKLSAIPEFGPKMGREWGFRGMEVAIQKTVALFYLRSSLSGYPVKGDTDLGISLGGGFSVGSLLNIGYHYRWPVLPYSIDPAISRQNISVSMFLPLKTYGSQLTY